MINCCSGAQSQREASPSTSLETSWPVAADNGNPAAMPAASYNKDMTALRQQLAQLQAQQAQHEEEIEQLKQEHTAQVVAIQTQAVNKMKELIDKVGTVAGQDAVMCRVSLWAVLSALFAISNSACMLQDAHLKQQNAALH